MSVAKQTKFTQTKETLYISITKSSFEKWFLNSCSAINFVPDIHKKEKLIF